MQYNTETGEQGLRTWAKKPSRMSLKHGRDIFTHSTSNHVGEMLLLNTASKLVQRKQAKTSMAVLPVTSANRRKVSHFRFERGNPLSSQLCSFDHDGREKVPDSRTGIIQ
jgi:hypothetical protein